MTETFKFTNSIYLSNGVIELDLHNNYDFTGFSYSIETRSVILSWKRRNDNWVPSSSPDRIEAIYEEVESFQFQPRNPDIPFFEDDCLANFGYWTDKAWCDGVFITEATPDPEWMKAFEFMSEANGTSLSVFSTVSPPMRIPLIPATHSSRKRPPIPDDRGQVIGAKRRCYLSLTSSLLFTSSLHSVFA